jgi:hypothetical protein
VTAAVDASRQLVLALAEDAERPDPPADGAAAPPTPPAPTFKLFPTVLDVTGEKARCCLRSDANDVVTDVVVVVVVVVVLVVGTLAVPFALAFCLPSIVSCHAQKAAPSALVRTSYVRAGHAKMVTNIALTALSDVSSDRVGRRLDAIVAVRDGRLHDLCCVMFLVLVVVVVVVVVVVCRHRRGGQCHHVERSGLLLLCVTRVDS